MNRSANRPPRLVTAWMPMLAILFVLWGTSPARADDLVATGSTWKYLDDGSDQGTAWRAIDFDDGGWAAGPAQLGYGEGDEATVVSYGSSSSNKFRTTYFRHHFQVTDASAFTEMTLRLLRDDGAVVYLNGQEVWRSNMPSGTIAYDTFAAGSVWGSDEDTFEETTLGTSLLRDGDNVLAVELHQTSNSSSDVSFDFALVATPATGSTDPTTTDPTTTDPTTTDPTTTDPTTTDPATTDPTATTTTTLVPAGSTWKYLDDGSDQGTAWRDFGFGDSGWAEGPAQLGYGDGDEATVVSYGPNSSSKYRTTYFRHHFQVAGATALTELTLRLLRDDGAIVYLNGQEVWRSNMGSGAIAYDDFAAGGVHGSDEDAFQETTAGTSLLQDGDNVIAVELHQNSNRSSDLSFDFELIATGTAPATNPTTTDPTTTDPTTTDPTTTDPTTTDPSTTDPTTTDPTTTDPTTTDPAPPTTLIAVGSTWKFLDDGSDQGTAWRNLDFGDDNWAEGPAQLGYGDGDEATVVSYGPNSSSKFRTTYFRHHFQVADASAFTEMTLRLLRDDGAIVYLNGQEIWRSNMGSGAIAYDDFAAGGVHGSDEGTFQETTAGTSLLLDGDNVIAVELHQNSNGSSDLSFDFALIATGGGDPVDPPPTTTPTTDPTTDPTTSPTTDPGSILVARGSTWKYLDDGSDQGADWRAKAFDDSLWASGPAQLGYGDGDEDTVVGFGPSSSSKYPTTYFRHAFTVAEPSLITGLTLRVLRDDGAIVYLNGTEVWRSNMPGGTVDYLTQANAAVGGSDEDTFSETSIDALLLEAGTNVLAVEIHQYSDTSSDISFDLELAEGSATSPTTDPATSPNSALTRGPYLQLGAPTSIFIRWRTADSTNSRVQYGTSADNLDQVTDDTLATTEHVVRLTGLSPNTRYWYSVGTTSTTLSSGADCTFLTAPAAGTAVATRIWALGDSGTANADARAVRDAFKTYTGTRDADVWLMLGDNAYPVGTDNDYQDGVFDTYPALLKKIVLWPTIGNHDVSSSSSGTEPYFDIFTLPAQAEAGGLASGTQNYYSFDHGDVHFVCLDSQVSDRSPSGAMLSWLANDLAATSRKWIIAYWHHPPYTHGSHNSDSEQKLQDMRENALPILESYSVDLVLGGHSHSYERSFLLDGHYGDSDTLTAAMVKDGGSGRVEDTGAYTKQAGAAHAGAVYTVCGSSGKVTTASLNHPAMFISLARLGSMVIDVDGNVMEVKFLRETGVVDDHFTIQKN